MANNWHDLVANLAVVALFISAWVHGQFLFVSHGRTWRNIAFGIIIGLGAVCSMALSIRIDGTLFDLRSSLITIAGFFGGPVAGIVAALIAIAYRMLQGGSAAIAGSAGIAASVIVGLVVSRLTRRRVPALATAALLAIAVAGQSLILSVVFRGPHASPDQLSLPVAGMNALATALCAFFIMRNRVIERERDLFRAAFKESPDFQYVKTTSHRFAVANTAAARINGFANAVDMIGKSDFDIAPFERAKALMLAEQKIIETGEPLLNVEEQLVGPHGEEIWYTTSKVPLHNAEGEIIGIAGITRDITARRRLRQEISDSRNQLNYVLSEITDGVAMFDRKGTLVYCNEQYCSYFPLSAAVRRPGQHIRDILKAVAETGEQRGIPIGGETAWVDEISATLVVTGEQEVQLFDGAWLHIRTRPTADGSALVVVSNVTRIKQAEETLRGLTEQLKELATTDGLTGLTNRRAFDQALENELSRCRRSMRPLALLMIDVDRFKTYNDIYGHQAGDAALRTVADCLRASLKRPGDIVARYGGEEFVAILPGTEEDGAFFSADTFRENLRALDVPHRGSEKGILTASIGIAVFTERDAGMNAVELVRRADQALYTAKDAGRDRVTGWRQRSEIRPIRRA
jgi:diguanylate cyclase (GGDEF)-like protein/PAS domain S-box-containing protein